jgi:hypothetical protein
MAPNKNYDLKARSAGVANSHLGTTEDGNGGPNRKGGVQAPFGRMRGHLIEYLRHDSRCRWNFHIPQHD